jgi:hypothetical protein
VQLSSHPAPAAPGRCAVRVAPSSQLLLALVAAAQCPAATAALATSSFCTAGLRRKLRVRLGQLPAGRRLRPGRLRSPWRCRLSEAFSPASSFALPSAEEAKPACSFAAAVNQTDFVHLPAAWRFRHPLRTVFPPAAKPLRLHVPVPARR